MVKRRIGYLGLSIAVALGLVGCALPDEPGTNGTAADPAWTVSKQALTAESATIDKQGTTATEATPRLDAGILAKDGEGANVTKGDSKTICPKDGDVNSDGVLSSGDAQLAFMIGLGMYSPTALELCAADCNGDGLVSSGDAQSIFMVALGMLPGCGQPNGSDCRYNHGCLSAHCQNAYCCDEGDCCNGTADVCPAEYTVFECADELLCQGFRHDPTCVDFMCGSSESINDDSGCTTETLSQTCGAYPSVYCSGEAEQMQPACPVACEIDDDCDPGNVCVNATCLAANGNECNDNAECGSGYCANGYCCDQGDCCNGDPAVCPAETYVTEPWCETPGDCQGFRIDAVCDENFQCGSTAWVDDDTACDEETEANDCGYYPSVFCTAEAEQTVGSCAGVCTVDADCDYEAHCQGGECLYGKPPGYTCADDAECVSLHCQNGFCCGSGDCCDVAASCPASYTVAPACDGHSPGTGVYCQGHRQDAVCVYNICDTTDPIDDDTACDTSIVVDACGYYLSATCSGDIDQPTTRPPCETACDNDNDCDPTGHCEFAFTPPRCFAGANNGRPCTANSECLSNHCQNGFCCDGTTSDCCDGTAGVCPASYTTEPLCDNDVTCQGHRIDPTCNDFVCGSTANIDDDSACTTETWALECALWTDIYCSGDADQTPPVCPVTCTTDAECDEEAHCDNGICEADYVNGIACDEDSDCTAGNTCSDNDGVCCNTECLGLCESCVVAGAEGTCTPVPVGLDPQEECGALPCEGWFVGFQGANADACYTASPIGAEGVGCDGAGLCQTAGQLCPDTAANQVQIDCNDTCMEPTGGTCLNQIPGACTNLDLGTQTCGTGGCARTVPFCLNGLPVTCVPGDPSATEVCNGQDDDCDGSTDEGDSNVLCPPGQNVVTTACSAGACRITACALGYGDIDGTFVNGCECYPDSYETNDTCAQYNDRGEEHDNSVADTKSIIGRISFTGDEDWYRVRAIDDVPTSSGYINDYFHLDVRFVSNPNDQYRFDVYRTTIGTCASMAALCYENPGSSTNYFSWYTNFNGTQLGELYCTNGYSSDSGGSHPLTTADYKWCSDNTAYYFVRVFRRTGAAPSCANYELRIINEHM